jgi:alpha-acetolactate decarboxylase
LFWMTVVAMPLAIGCTSSETPEKKPSSPSWDGKVEQWGTLREVMHGEVMRGQVLLSDVVDKPHVFGIGAPDQLQGEIVIADSAAWVAKVQEGERIETRPSVVSDSAVFLAVSQVPRWIEVRIERDVAAGEFDDFVQKVLRQAGLNELEAVPFAIEGRFAPLKLHVLRGQCPFAEVKVEAEGSGPPLRTTLKDARGLLVGFYSEKGAGRITHHWTRSHVHALVGIEDDRVAGHVDAVALKAGSVVRVPAYPAKTRQIAARPRSN